MSLDSAVSCSAARRRAGTAPGRYGFAFDRLREERKGNGNTSIYTDVVEAGVVAWPTWLMILALPEQLRKEYEGLEVDTILFYPRKMVAEGGAAFDALVREHAHEDTPWRATIDMAALEQTIKRRIDDDHVALKFMHREGRLFQPRCRW
jgi:hypothetical protein